jgi:hypothetical protein
MNELQIYHRRKAEMSKGQKLLLEKICKCIRDKEPLIFEDVVMCYYAGVKKTLFWANYQLDQGQMCSVGMHRNYDILHEYETNSYIWNRKIRDLIKSWFVSAIGLLVIKGWLTVLPVITID